MSRDHNRKGLLQVRMFQFVFASSIGLPEERFARALEYSSDDAWERAQRHPAFRKNLAAYIRATRNKRQQRKQAMCASR